MTRIFFLFLALLIFLTTASAQSHQKSSILLRATTSVTGGAYFIEILPYEHTTKIIFKLKKQVQQAAFEADTNTIRYRQILQSIKNIKPDNDSVKTYSAKLDSVSMSYTLYDTDSLTVINAEHEGYLNLIREVLNSPTEILENKHHFVLDGTSMVFKLTNKDIERTVYAYSPTVTSNPILYKLITETTAIYRNTKRNDFLNKQRTYGY